HLSSRSAIDTFAMPVTASAAAFSPDGRRLVTGSQNDWAQVWDTATGALVAGPLRHHRDVLSCAFSPDGSLVATGSDDCAARVWDAATSEPVSPYLKHPDRVIFVGFTHDGNSLVSVDASRTIRSWALCEPSLRADQLVHMARVYSGHEINAAGYMVP